MSALRGMLVKTTQRLKGVAPFIYKDKGRSTRRFQLGSSGVMEGKKEAQTRVDQLKKMPSFFFRGTLYVLY